MQTLAARSRSVLSFGDGALEDAILFGEGLPAEAEKHVRIAGGVYPHDGLAEWHLRQAQRLAPEHPAVLIALYRFYFYKNRLSAALDVARACFRKAAEHNRLDVDWRKVRASDARFDAWELAVPRFYLFTLKAYSYLLLRLGQIDEGREVALKLLELDPTNKLSGRVLLDVVERMGQSDND